MKRWKCPECDSGKLAPTRPRRNDVRRYCLPCSERTGYLVERTCPAAAAKKQRAAARRLDKAERAKVKKEKAELALAKEAGVRLEYAVDFGTEEWARRWACKWLRRGAATWDSTATAARRLARYFSKGEGITVRRRGHYYTTGVAYGSWQFALTVGTSLPDAYATLLHELTHLVVPGRHGHDHMWRSYFMTAAHVITGVRPKTDGKLTKHSVHRAVINAFAEWMKQGEDDGTTDQGQG